MQEPKPSTQWTEVVDPDEDQRFASYAQRFAELQQRKSAKQGEGRALHRKQVLAIEGQLTVLDDLPDFARHGLFAQPNTYRTVVRLSNGGMDRAPDRKPDIRGFSLAVQGVHGDSALGHGPTNVQCFALINRSNFGFANSVEFVEVAMAATRGPAALLKHLIRRHGFLAGTGRMLGLVKSISQPFAGFAHQSFFSAAPIACGPYAVRVRLRPTGDHGTPDTDAQSWGLDMAKRLATRPLHYALDLQPYLNDKLTPIEDASIEWLSPYTEVATLILPRQVANPDTDLTREAEAGVFDPWAALAAHRPLGEVMRARKVVYFQSQKGRGAA